MLNLLARSLIGLTCVLVPGVASADVDITEIMYDLELGSDTGREWIEVHNTGDTLETLTSWKLFEASVNHGIAAYSGGETIAPGAYAVIADNPVKFLEDWPLFAGPLFDSAFSLGNSGETLTMRCCGTDLSDRYTVSYVSGWGAAGDGTSLQSSGTSWSAYAPTPGASLGAAAPPPPAIDDMTESTSFNESSGDGAGSAPVEPRISLVLGGDRTVIVGAAQIFDARVIGLSGDPIENARVVWNFGNGDRREGTSVLYQFSRPGRYAVTVDASSGLYAAAGRLVVSAVPAALSVSAVTPEYIEIQNTSGMDVDVGLWLLSDGIQTFMLPPRTVILSGERVAFSNRATGLAPQDASMASLRYPDGIVAASYQEPLITARTKDSPPTSVRVSRSLETNEPPPDISAASLITAPVIPSGGDAWGWEWFVALGGVVVIGIGAAVLLRRPDNEYRILESYDT